MSEYNHTLTTTADIKKLNLQNMQLSIRIAELEKENKALKDKLAQLIIKGNNECQQCISHNAQTLTEFVA